MKQNKWTESNPLMHFMIVILVIFLFVIPGGCTTKSIDPTEETSSAEPKNDARAGNALEFVEKDNNEVNDPAASAYATESLKEYLYYYGINNHDVRIVSTPVTDGETTMGSLFFNILGSELILDGQKRSEFTVLTASLGKTPAEANINAADKAVSLIGDPLIGYLSGQGFDFVSGDWGGYGFQFLSFIFFEEDEKLIRDFTGDIFTVAESILESVTPVLSGEISELPDDYSAGDPINCLQIILLGTETGSGNNVSLIVTDDESGELKAHLKEYIDWPDVKGMYSISFVYGLR